MENEYCEYSDSDCKYLAICKGIMEGYACLKDLLGEDLILKPEYSPEAIIKRIKHFGHRPIKI